jgi:hypothetical protein
MRGGAHPWNPIGLNGPDVFQGGLVMKDDYEGAVAGECSADAEDQRKLEEWAEKLSLSVDDLKVFCRHGFYYEKVPATNTPSRRALLAYLKRADTGPSKWLLISGLYPECQYSEAERRKRLRALYRAVVLLIKRALIRHASEEADERSIFWDPIAEICRDLELPASKLSSFCKEYSGHSLSQVVDCVRAERIKKVLKVKIRLFVREFRTHCASSVQDAPEEMDCWGVWKALKKSRRWPEFCRNTWAIELGFSSYRRLYRACLAVWKQTPHQLELALISDCLRADELKNSTDDVFEKELNYDEIQELVRSIAVYVDEG